MSTGHESLYADIPGRKKFPKLDSKEAQLVDVLVIGAGFTGLTAALLLQRAGKNVMIVDQGEVAGGESAYSTAQLTELVDTRYHTLVSDFGRESAGQVALSSRAAMTWVASTVADLQIDCDLERVASFLYCDNDKDISEIDKEFEAMRYCGLTPQRVAVLPPEFRARAAIQLNDQMQLHPRKYLEGLVRELAAKGAQIFEHTRVVEIEDGKTCRVKTEDGAAVIANDVVVATHTPICNLVLLHTKLASYRTYVMGIMLNGAQPQLGQYFDTQDPYHYTRRALDQKQPVWLIGGEDHKTGTLDDTDACYQRLEGYIRDRFDVAAIKYSWSGQVIESVDGLPFIGKNSASEHLYVGTGYAGNGTTFGTLAGMLICDQIMGRPNQWTELYHATRVKPIAGAADFVSENADAAYRWIADRVSKQDFETIQSMPPDSGGIFTIEGKKVAVSRSAKGYEYHSAVCTHLSCIVHWNSSEKSWDCPCHGARFDHTGKVINGPAIKDLEKIQVPAGTRA